MCAERMSSRLGKRSVKDRLGTNFNTWKLNEDLQTSIKGQHQIDTKRDHDFSREIIQIRRGVPDNLSSMVLQEDLPRSSNNQTPSNLREMHGKILRISRLEHTKPISSVRRAVPDDLTATIMQEDPPRSSKNQAILLAQKPVTQSASIPSTTDQTKKAELTVAAFLQRLGLSKYNFTFQAEEVDMFALKHMDDQDLKQIGLPMGPRKKILLALSSAKMRKSDHIRHSQYSEQRKSILELV
ncbi:uncharacterized protein LOC143846105 isoform X2 [Tasmannia lanceolata]|uniref:uncharacterized protein LOC143846105 isoform X2 n=1 Tax=Tasmannia lanceolata TaxID=3420 RepID=UPI004063378B